MSPFPSSEITQNFAQNGYVSGVPLLTDSETANARSKVLALISAFGDDREVIRNVASYMTWAYDLATRPLLLNQIEEIVGPEILLLGSMLLLKSPGSASVVLWHADQAFQNHPGSNHVAAWLALNPSNQANGCVKVVAGSHLHSHPHHQVDSPNNQVKKALTLVDVPDPEQVRYLELTPGQFSLHNPQIVHGSEANTSDVLRIGLILRYGSPAQSDLSVPYIQIRGQSALSGEPIVPCRFPGSDESRIPALISYNLATEARMRLK